MIDATATHATPHLLETITEPTLEQPRGEWAVLADLSDLHGDYEDFLDAMAEAVGFPLLENHAYGVDRQRTGALELAGDTYLVLSVEGEAAMDLEDRAEETAAAE